MSPVCTALPFKDSPITNAEWNQLCGIMNGYIYSQTLATACDLDVFTFLETHPQATLDAIAEGLGLSQYAARVLMLACCATKLIVKNERGQYANSGLASKVLVARVPYSMIDFIKFNHQVQQRCSVHLTAALREKRNAGLDEFPGEGNTLYSRLAAYPDVEALFQRAMGAYTRLSPKMAHLPEFEHVRKLLDVGGGDGSNAIRLCERLPKISVSILDIPTVVSIAEKNIATRGLSSRVTCYALDMFADQWPMGHDAVLLSHVVEIFSPERIKQLYRLAYEALPPGGRLFIWTIMANDNETMGLQASKTSIYFLSTASGEGMAYPARDHELWLGELGFSSVTCNEAGDIEHGAIVAVR
jgi:O-methyltransferase domain/Dimerisation domain